MVRIAMKTCMFRVMYYTNNHVFTLHGTYQLETYSETGDQKCNGLKHFTQNNNVIVNVKHEHSHNLTMKTTITAIIESN